MHFLTESFQSQISFQILLQSQNYPEYGYHRPSFQAVLQLMPYLYHDLYKFLQMIREVKSLLLLLVLRADVLIPVQFLQHLLCESSTVRPSLVLRCQINSYIFSCLCMPFVFDVYHFVSCI